MKWRIGEVTVTKVVELEFTGGTRFILPQATREAVREMHWLKPHFMNDEGQLIMSVHALVIETPSRRIVVDTCIGNDKSGRMAAHWNNMQGPFLANLASAGYARESIDTVLCTHLHVDHVGWNTMLVDGHWVATFPNARYLMAKAEFDYWRGGPEGQGHTKIFTDSVQPVFDAGLVDLVDTDQRICDEVRLMPTLGHTPGHVSVAVESAGMRALITGDFVHHPCQMAHPEWASSADYDAVASTATRHAMFNALGDTPTLVIGTHFAGATAGHVVREGDAWRFVA